MFKADWVPWFAAGLIGIVGCTALVLATGTLAEDDLPERPRQRTIYDVDPTILPTIQLPAKPAPTATPRPGPTWADVLEMQMAEYTHVREVSVEQDGNTISLVIIVGYATNQTYARQLGDSFVRMAMTLLKDGTPGREIGAGKRYDYLVGVYFPNEERLALGAKARVAGRITWD